MASLLLTRDARTLRTLARPPWQRRALQSSIFLAALGVATLHTMTAPVQRCTETDPCQPDAASALVGGLLFAAGLAGYLHARTAAWLAGAFAVGVVGYDLAHPGMASPTWLYVVDLGYVGVCIAVAAVGRGPRTDARALAWLTRVPREQPPAPPALPPIGRGWRLASALCLLAALAVVGVTWYRQASMSAREDAADRVTAEVVGPVDGYTVRVRLPGGDFRDVGVLSALDHPAGHRMIISTDARGLQQPVSDPYDVTAWLALGVTAAGVALACRARAAERATGLHNLFTQPQPVTQVYVRAGWGVVAVYPGDARPGEPAVTELSCVPTDDDQVEPHEDDARMHILPTRPALLYGVPVPGRWCTVAVDGEPTVPVGPVPPEAIAPSFTDPTPGGGPEPVAEPDSAGTWADAVAGLGPPHPGDLPLRPEEVAALSPADRDDNPFQVRTHGRAKAVGYGLIAGVPLILLAPASLLPPLPVPVALLLAGAVLAASCAVGWRRLLGTRLAWNQGGVAMVGPAGLVGPLGTARMSWPHVRRIDRSRHDVTIHTVDGARTFPVPEHGGHGWLGRSPEQLANALRYAKERANATVDPPRLAVPRPPTGLYALWLAGTLLYAGLLVRITG